MLNDAKMLRDFKGKNGSWRTIKETVLEDYFLNLSFIQQKSLPTWCPNILINSPSPFFNFRNALSLKMCNWFKLWKCFLWQRRLCLSAVRKIQSEFDCTRFQKKLGNDVIYSYLLAACDCNTRYQEQLGGKKICENDSYIPAG